MFQLKRHNNPILIPSGDGFDSKAVFNPAVTKKDSIVYMLYRAVGDADTYKSSFGLATSSDFVSFERVYNQPVFSPHTDYTIGGVEDPRVVQIDDIFYITYAAVPQFVFEHGVSPINRKIPLITSGALITTTDFKQFNDLGIITPLNADDKDVVLFPETIDGMYIMIHRPFFWSKTGYTSPEASHYEITLPCNVDSLPEKPSAWISFSNDLKNWERHVVMDDLFEKETDKIGPGMPPIKTMDGWLLIYHNVRRTEVGNVYTAKAALLDLKDPTKVIARIPYNILKPEIEEETNGFVKNVVFPTGGFIDNGTLYVYYGAGDESIHLATGDVQELIQELKNNKI